MTEQNYNEEIQPQTTLGGQPQPTEQPTIGEQIQPEQQTMPKIQMKKPKKLGWIITLVLFVISFIGGISGVVLVAINNPVSIASDLDPKVEKFLDGKEESGFINDVDFSVNDNGFTYKGLTKGKAYVFVLWQTSDEMAENIKFDNQNVAPFLSDNPNSKTIDSRTVKNRKYYYVVAQGSEMNIAIDNLKSTSGRIALNETKEVTSKVEMLAVGAVLCLIFGIATAITLVVFITFLVLYLVKRNKYKSTSHFNY